MSDILLSLTISLKTSIAATLITFCLGTAAAWWMSRYQGRGKSIIETIFTAPLILPPTVVGFLLLLALGKNGWLGQLLYGIGIKVVFTWYATVIAAIVVSFPLMYRSALNAFEGVDRHLIDCGRTLGVSETRIFWHIILPLARPGLVTGILLTFARALGEFGATIMLAGNIPGKTQTIPIAIYQAGASGEIDRALGLVVLLLAISLAISFILQRGENPIQSAISKTKYRNSRTAKNWQVDNSNQIVLEVQIQKQLPDFLLDISFKIDAKQSPLAILGVSGSGKTTLLRCITGLATPDRGVITLNQITLFDSERGINLSPQERNTSLVWQNYALFPHLTIADNIAFGMSAVLSRSQVARNIDRQLHTIGLNKSKHCLAAELSGGEQQRVALARAFAREPQLTLLDEPCSALDTNLKARLLQFLKQRMNEYRGLTLYVTHNLSEAYRLCPQILVVDRGKAVAFGDRSTIFNRPPNIQTARLIGCQNFSTVKIIHPLLVEAVDWQCRLQLDRPISNHSHLAIHAHHLKFVAPLETANVFPVWLVEHYESLDRVTVKLKLHSAPRNFQDYHLIGAISYERWRKLQQQTQPWSLQLHSEQVIYLYQ